MCLPASAILESFEAMLMYFKACGRSLLWNWLLKLILKENLLKIASKPMSIVAAILANIVLAGYHIFHIFGSILVSITTILTSIVTILANIALAGDHIFQVLAQYSWVLP